MRGWKSIPCLTLVLFASISAFSVSVSASAKPSTRPGTEVVTSSISSNESSIQLIIRYLFAAEATYISTAGNGRYGTLQQLYTAHLIDSKLRTGFGNGYRFVLTVSNPTGGPSSFEVIARPLVYMESGVRTFSFNEYGVMRVSYRENATPAQMEVVADNCDSIGCTEAFGRQSLRTIHSAEATFQATVGNGRYGTLQELVTNYLISPALANGILNGYRYEVRIDNGGGGEPPSFQAVATPIRYGITGIYSLYIDETGILRGGNKYGHEASADDEPLCY